MGLEKLLKSSGLIATKSTSNVTQEVNPIILRESSTTRLIFSPVWVDPEKTETDHPLRGGFHFQKKGGKDNWENIPSRPLSSLKKGEGYSLSLNGDEIDILISELKRIREVMIENGHYNGTRFIPLNEENADQFVLDLTNVDNKDMVEDALKKLQDDKFANLEAFISKVRVDNVIQEFEDNLTNADESFWQDFFEKNNDVFSQVFPHTVTFLKGETYVGGKSTRGRDGQGGVATDFLFKHGSNGSFGVVEIKTPTTSIMSRTPYRGGESGATNTTFAPHKDLGGAIIQLENQIQTALEKFKDHLDEVHRDENLSRLNPFGLLVVGCYQDLTDDEKRSFELFRKSVRVQILTFDEVLEKIKSINSLYE